MNKQETRQALLEAGRNLIFQQGYNNTGLNEILASANIPKGSFYYYFASKEDFGLQVLDSFIERNNARLAAFLQNGTGDPLEQLRGYFDQYARYLESLQCSRGCLLGNLGQELADQNEAFRGRIDETMQSLSDNLAECLRVAQQAGQVNPALDADELAAFIYNSWQGALLRMKVTKSIAPIEAFQHTIFNVILKP